MATISASKPPRDGELWLLLLRISSSWIARSIALRNSNSSRSISNAEVERISTRMLADSGIEFTEVPP